jgi:hypothetical protein
MSSGRRPEKLGADPWPRSPIGGGIVLDWPRRYDITPVDSDRPQDAAEYGFPTTDPGDAARFVVYPMGGTPWVGAFAYGRMKKFLDSTVTNGPREDWFTVVAASNAYLVNAFNPAEWIEIEVDPVMDVRASTEFGLVFFADFTDLIAYDATGKKWRSQRLAYDGLRIDRIDSSGIHGVGWNAPTDALLPFVVDPLTGEGSSDAYR